jgi:hypothetical protein
MKYWGKVGAFWGRLLGAFVRICSFHNSGSRPNFSGGTDSCVDRGRIGRRGGGRSVGSPGSWPLQHRNP